MKYILPTLIVLGAILLVTQQVDAAYYQYVTTSGTISTVVANDPNTALAIAPSRAPNSGVIVVSGDATGALAGNTMGTSQTIYGVGGFPGMEQYSYVNRSGVIMTIQAENSMQALMLATDIAPNSGVMLKTSVAPQTGTSVPL